MELIKSLEEKGFFIFKNESVIEFKKLINETLCEAVKTIMKLNKSFLLNLNLDNILDVGELVSHIHRYEKENFFTRSFYEVFPSIPSVISLINHDLILKIVSFAGIKQPLAGTVPLIRFDRPNEDHFLTPWHQDFWYSFLSENSIVIWFPLSNITDDMGHLKIIEGSHKKGVFPFKKHAGNEPYEPIMKFDEKEASEVRLDENEILVFNQKLVHKSGQNRSDKIRITIQFRFNDLCTAKKITSTFTPNHSPYVLNEQSKLLQSNLGE